MVKEVNSRSIKEVNSRSIKEVNSRSINSLGKDGLGFALSPSHPRRPWRYEFWSVKSYLYQKMFWLFVSTPFGYAFDVFQTILSVIAVFMYIASTYQKSDEQVEPV